MAMGRSFGGLDGLFAAQLAGGMGETEVLRRVHRQLPVAWISGGFDGLALSFAMVFEDGEMWRIGRHFARRAAR